MEKLQQDSTVSLPQHQQTVAVAIAEAAKGGSDTLAAEHSLVAKLATSSSVKSGVAAVVHTELSSQHSSSLFIRPSRKSRPNSLFVGGGGNKREQAQARTPLVPMTYDEKKRAPKDDIAARSRITGMSLTGTTTSGGRAVPIRGALIASAMRKPLEGIAELLQELAVVNRALQNPYAGGPKRLAKDLGKGVDNALQFAQRAPEAVMNLRPA